MALAQDTDLLLLDEPTTYLDINHQVELLRLLRKLNAESGKTIVVVLHDLNLACRFCDHVIAMADGAIVAEGAPDRGGHRRAGREGLRPGLRRRARPGRRHADGRAGLSRPAGGVCHAVVPVTEVPDLVIR